MSTLHGLLGTLMLLAVMLVVAPHISELVNSKADGGAIVEASFLCSLMIVSACTHFVASCREYDR